MTPEPPQAGSNGRTGHVTPALGDRIQSTIDRWVADGDEVGIQVAVVVDGTLVVDAAAGAAGVGDDADPVGSTTLLHGFSTAKGIASAVAHVLMDRGRLDPDLTIAEVWPEFAAHGKQHVTVRHVLLHTAGVPAPPYDTTVEDLCDWDRMCARIAAERPWWEAGTRFGYHAITFGFLLGETVRRATGHDLTHWLHELITRPLGIVDEVHFGVPSQLLDRVAPQVTAPGYIGAAPAPGSTVDRAIPPGVRPDADYANRSDVLAADIPSGGTMTARGAALVYAGLLGHVADVELVSGGGLAEMAAVAFAGGDEVMGIDAEWAYGFSAGRPSGMASRPGSVFGMVGANGSGAYADIDSATAFAVMRNRYDGPNLRAVADTDRLLHQSTAT